MKTSKTPIILMIIGGFLLVLYGAYRYDAYLRAEKIREEKEKFNVEILFHEANAISSIKALGLEESLATELKEYDLAADASEKRDAFKQLIQSASPLIAGVSVENPVQRRFSDEYLGALNRLKRIHEQADN